MNHLADKLEVIIISLDLLELDDFFSFPIKSTPCWVIDWRQRNEQILTLIRGNILGKVAFVVNCCLFMCNSRSICNLLVTHYRNSHDLQATFYGNVCLSTLYLQQMKIINYWYHLNVCFFLMPRE